MSAISKIFLLVAFILTLCGEVGATVLGDAANALSAGQWSGPITGMTNLNDTGAAFATSGTPGPGFDGAQPGWNTHDKKIYISTTEHGISATCPDAWPNFPNNCYKQMWVYDDSTNIWTVGKPPNVTMPFMNNGGNPVAGFHHWYEVAWDDDNQILYGREYYTGRFYRYCVNNTPAVPCSGKANTWSKLQQDNPYWANCCQQMAYHAALQKLIYFDGSTQTGTCGIFAAWSEATGTWSEIGNSAGCAYPVPPVGGPNESRNMLGGYSHVKQIAVFGGGTGSGSNSKFYGVNAAGSVVTIDPVPSTCPSGMGSTTGNDGGMYNAFAEDPVSGNFIAIGCGSAGKIHQLNPTASPGSQWTLIANTLNATGQICNQSRNPINGCSFDFWPIPISTYGVIGYWKFRTGNTAEFWLYKPSASVGDITPPSSVVVTAPTAGATVSGTVTPLSATAVDETGIAGVQFKVDGTNVGAEDTVAPYSIIWDTTGIANGTHSISAVARDAANNTATSSAVNVTVSNAVAGGSDFATRCKATGVLVCIGFEAGDVDFSKRWGDPRGVSQIANVGSTQWSDPVLDTSIKASGSSSIKMTIPANSGPDTSGSYWANFSDDYLTQLNGNDSITVQWRQRFSSCFLHQGSAEPCTGALRTYAGADGWKQAIITTGDRPGCTPSTAVGELGLCFSSCSEIETVPVNTYHRGMVDLYHTCPSSFTTSSTVSLPGGDFNLQNGMPLPFCLYSQGPNFFPPNGNCFPYVANEWMTFKMRIFLGSRVTRGSDDFWPNSTVEMWVAREGQPSVRVINWVSELYAGPTSGTFGQQKIGKVFLIPYNSKKDSTETNPVAYTWYDELIISRDDIADPGVGGQTPPIAPSGFKLK